MKTAAFAVALATLGGLVACAGQAEDSRTEAPATGASYSSGLATTTTAGLIDCGGRSRVSAVGAIATDDGREWIVPAQTSFGSAAIASDLYNDCGGMRLNASDALDLDTIPLIDAGGSEEFVAYVFADNYFELFVNGQLVGVDAVPFTPFNSSVVRFKADRPLTLAFKLVDWEEHLGLGMEAGGLSRWHPGDGGLVAHFKDADGETVAITDSSWRAQTFYTSPLRDRSCLKLAGAVRDSSDCDDGDAFDGSGFSAAFWPVPSDWATPGFDDSDWPQAAIYTNETVVVNNKPAFMNFTDLFDDPVADAQFIWSSNLILDNLVLARKTVD